MFRCWVFKRWVGAAAVFLPLAASSDSQVQTGAPDATVSASARLDFRIIIPTVLALRIGENATVASNNRTATLNATLTSAGTPSTNTPGSTNSTSANLILTAAAGNTIIHESRCVPKAMHEAAPAVNGRANTDHVFCTVSMP
jgi:hypothetical protein